MENPRRTKGRITSRGAITITAALSLLGSLAAPSGAYPRPGRTERISISSTGGEGVGMASHPPATAISSNGRFVAFTSDDSVLGPINEVTGLPQDNVFVFDRSARSLELASVGQSGLSVAGDSDAPGLSANGRYLAFQSDAPALTSELDTNLLRDVYIRDLRTGENTLISRSIETVAGQGKAANGESVMPHISASGRYVVFESGANDLIAGDTNDANDIFLWDRKARGLERLSRGIGGAESDGESGCASITPDGRYVVFGSGASNLVGGDARPTGQEGVSDEGDVFLYDRHLKRTELISVSSDGAQGDYPFWSGAGTCGSGAVSDDARYVAFSSLSGNLIPNDGGGLDVDVFVRDRVTNRTTRVSVSSAGEEAQGSSGATLSRDGRFVVFASNSGGLVGDDTVECTPSVGFPPIEPTCMLGDLDVFVHDLTMGATEMITVDPHGREATYGCGSLGLTSSLGGITPGGRFLSFGSCSGSLVEGDTNDAFDAFVRDRGISMGTAGTAGHGGSVPGEDPPADRICVTPDICIPPGAAVSSSDATADVDEVLTKQGANIYSALLAYRPQHEDLFMVIELEHMPQVIPGLSPIFYGLRFEGDDKSYEARATSLLGGTFGLFDCTGSHGCTKIADLEGGYGTTGMRVVFSLPLDQLGLTGGARLGNVTAFSALGSYWSGAGKVLDKVAIR